MKELYYHIKNDTVIIRNILPCIITRAEWGRGIPKLEGIAYHMDHFSRCKQDPHGFILKLSCFVNADRERYDEKLHAHILTHFQVDPDSYQQLIRNIPLLYFREKDETVENYTEPPESAEGLRQLAFAVNAHRDV